MKQIIIDHFWRKSWIVIPILLVELFVVREFGTTTRHDEFIFLLLPMYIGPSLLSYDLQQGFTRALMALPVTAGQIGRAWWLSTVGVPALLLAAATGLSAIVPLEGGQSGLLFLNCLVQVLLLGSCFCVWSFMPANYQGSWPEKVRGGFMGALWGLSFGGGIAFFRGFSWSNPLKAEVFMGISAILMAVGWFRAERMVLQRGAVRPGAQATTSKSAPYRVPAGFGGVPYLWRSLLLRLGWYGLVFVGWMILATVLIGIMGGRPWQHPLRHPESIAHMFGFASLFLVCLVAIPPILAHLRLLRTLPISTSILAATLVLFPAGSILAFGVACAAIGGGHQILGSYLVPVVAVAVLVPVFVCLGISRGTYFALIGFVVVSAMAQDFFDSTNVPPTVAALVAVFAIALAWEITRRVLRSSSQAYRVRSSTFGNWGGMRWS